MTRHLIITLALFHAAHLVGAEKEDPFNALVRPTGALSPDEERVKLKVPPGFTMQLFAAEPMINKPINIALDARGRLWVSSTTEYPFAAATTRWEDAQGSRVRGSREAIKILEDTDGDGRADKIRLAALPKSFSFLQRSNKATKRRRISAGRFQALFLRCFVVRLFQFRQRLIEPYTVAALVKPLG